jgi:hypothetical protein
MLRSREGRSSETAKRYQVGCVGALISCHRWWSVIHVSVQGPAHAKRGVGRLAFGCWAVRREEAERMVRHRTGPVLNPIAEEIGLIVVLASWQMRVAIRDEESRSRCEKFDGFFLSRS